MSASTAVNKQMSWAKIVNPNSTSSTTKQDVVAIIDIIHTHEETKTKKPLRQEVDYRAAEMAKNFYEQCQEKIIATARRNDLEKLFNQFFPNPEREFSVVLFAMAKGLKCVNVFNRGQDLEWFKTSKTAINRTFRNLKKPVQTTDGWTTVGGKLEDFPTSNLEPCQNPEHTAPNFRREIETVPTLPETTETTPLSLDQIVSNISGLKQEIADLDTEIEALLAFHREHLREINRTTEISNKSLGQHLREFHTSSVQRIEQVLDDIQSEINQKREKVALYCDMLKQ